MEKIRVGSWARCKEVSKHGLRGHEESTMKSSHFQQLTSRPSNNNDVNVIVSNWVVEVR